MSSSKDPYAAGKFISNPYACKNDIIGKLVVTLDGKLENRGLSLISPPSRCVCRHQIHELILTDEPAAMPGGQVDRIAYLGFFSVSEGGVILRGDTVWLDEQCIGAVAGFDETHMPNHLNIVISTTKLTTGLEAGARPGARLRFSMPQSKEEQLMTPEAKLKELQIELPVPAIPLAAYVPVVITDGWAYTSGQIPMVNGKLAFAGKVGGPVDEIAGNQAARICAINCLAALKAALGSLDRIERVVKVVGFVNSASGFTAQPKVINGASELLVQVFGDAGKHARSAVGVAELPLDAACEVELVVKLK
jgi:enamine deaminase RidA (YjgF/YER057c/UK114 family)